MIVEKDCQYWKWWFCFRWFLLCRTKIIVFDDPQQIGCWDYLASVFSERTARHCYRLISSFEWTEGLWWVDGHAVTKAQTWIETKFCGLGKSTRWKRLALFVSSFGEVWKDLSNTIKFSRSGHTSSFNWISVVESRGLKRYTNFWHHRSLSPEALRFTAFKLFHIPKGIWINHLYFECISIRISDSWWWNILES
jgi:hypothetical protein